MTWPVLLAIHSHNFRGKKVLWPVNDGCYDPGSSLSSYEKRLSLSQRVIMGGYRAYSQIMTHLDAIPQVLEIIIDVNPRTSLLFNGR